MPYQQPITIPATNESLNPIWDSGWRNFTIINGIKAATYLQLCTN